jgi:hypothetical protein
MNTHALNIRHVDEITVWTWIAGLVFALLCLASVAMVTTTWPRTATLDPQVLPIVQPAPLPPGTA